MKTFLVVAGLLMTGASVYGVVDYNAKTKNAGFKELYKDTPFPDETKIIKEKPAIPVLEKHETSTKEVGSYKKAEPLKNAATKKKGAKKKAEERKFRLKEFSRGKMG